MTADQQTAALHAQVWIDIARETVDPIEKEQHTQRAIKNLMIASHGR
jgi:hypothetical protein